LHHYTEFAIWQEFVSRLVSLPKGPVGDNCSSHVLKISIEEKKKEEKKLAEKISYK
jgi:hypothetical protein